MKVFCGTLAHATQSCALEVLEKRAVGVDAEGKIVFIEDMDECETLKQKYSFGDRDIVSLLDGEFLVPGFVDTHMHSYQYPMAGTKIGLPLEDWLREYLFPHKALYEDLKFAKSVYRKTVHRLLRNGTTTVSYYLTSDLLSSMAMVDLIDEMGQRAHVGHLVETKDDLKKFETFVSHVQQKNNHLMTPCVTLPWANSVEKEDLRAISDFQVKHDLPCQTHVAETPDLTLLNKFHPEAGNPVEVLDKTGWLNDKVTLGHAIYMEKRHYDRVKETKSGISHCPNSNLSLLSGLLDVRYLLDRGIKVGLGTDVSAGYACTILDTIRCAVHISSVLRIQRGESYKPLDYKESFRLATLGGAQVLGLDDRIGNFQTGKEFDALLISTKESVSPFDIFDDDTMEDIVQKFINLGDDRNIRRVYVTGKQVAGTDLSSN